jgi:protein O-mannosyl-transferase
MSRKMLFLLACGVLVLLCVIAYLPLWRNDFIDFDDLDYILDNPHVRDGLSSRGLIWAFTTSHTGSWIPLIWVSMQFDATVSSLLYPLLLHQKGPSPVIFHAQNLFWHTATVVLLFVTLQRMTKQLGPSIVVAALFAVHPLHVESVAWATERKDTLSTFFWMLTLYAYVHYAELPSRNRYALVLGGFALGLLSKPMLVTLPCVLLLLDYWPLRRLSCSPSLSGEGRGSSIPKPLPLPPSPKEGGGTDPAPVGLWSLLSEKLPLFALAAAVAAITVLTQGKSNAVVPTDVLTTKARLANSVISYGWYLEKTFWPTDLCIYYIHPLDKWSLSALLTSVGVLIAISIVAIVTARRAPWLLVGWLWFLGTLVPVIGLLQVGGQARADRYLYVPHIGLFIAIVWSIDALMTRIKIPKMVGLVLAVVCVGALIPLTWIQLGYWRNAETVWTHATDVTEGNHRAYAALGRLLIFEGKKQNDPQMFERGSDYARRALELNPNVAEYRYNYGVVQLLHGDLEKAIDNFRKTLKLDPSYSDARFNLGLAQRRLHDFAGAEKTFGEILDLENRKPVPNPAPDVLAQHGALLWETGRYTEARKEWETALRKNAQTAEALNGMGLVALREGDLPKATQRFQEALKADGSLMSAASNLGLVAGRQGAWTDAARLHEVAVKYQLTTADRVQYLCRWALALHETNKAEDARKTYAEATELQPNWRRDARTKAWELATAATVSPGDAATAWELASQVCQAVSVPSADDLDILSAALAARGLFDQAVPVARLAASRADAAQASVIAARVTLYEKRQRFLRDP